MEKSSEEIPTRAEAKRIVLDKCIFGVDKNPRAVKLAKMSLWLESAHPGKKLERLEDQLFEGDYLKLNQIKDIDFYIGNPPYFSVDDVFGKGHPYLGFLKKTFHQIYNDKTDIYYYFLGKAFNESKKGIGFIISRSFLEADKAKKLRMFLGHRDSMISIIDFRGYNIFNVGITAAILNMNKIRSENSFNFYKLMNEHTSQEDLIKDINGNYKLFEYGNLDAKRIISGDWRMVPKDDEELFKLIEKDTVSLGKIDRFFIGQGMQSGANDVFQIKLHELDQFRDCQKYLKKRARNSLIQKYSFDKEKDYFIYIEDLDSFEKIPKPIQERLKSYSDKLRNRAAFKRGNCEWFRFTWPLHKEKIWLPRLICPFCSSESRFALDKNFEWLGSTDTYSVFLENGDIEDLIFIQGILNSRLIDFWYQRVAKLKSKDIYEYFENSLAKIPIRERIDPDLKNNLIELVKLANGNPQG